MQTARPPEQFLRNLAKNPYKFPILAGQFNPAIQRLDDEKLVCVLRPTETSFAAMLLNNDLTIRPKTWVDLEIDRPTDPRLVWLNNQLLMTYSSHDAVSYMVAAVLIDRHKDDKIIQKPIPFRLSPRTFQTHQKNWMPFVHNNKLHMIESVNPHIVHEYTLLAPNPNQPIVCSNTYKSNYPKDEWFFPDFKRGNCPPLLMEDGNYLSTFHTVQKIGKMHFYDNGAYVFEGRPPFKILRMANKTYLPAEAATEKHYRKEGVIQVCFPLGMLEHQNNLLISYGDNDSAVKIMKTSIDDMTRTTLPVNVANIIPKTPVVGLPKPIR